MFTWLQKDRLKWPFTNFEWMAKHFVVTVAHATFETKSIWLEKKELKGWITFRQINLRSGFHGRPSLFQNEEKNFLLIPLLLTLKFLSVGKMWHEKILPQQVGTLSDETFFRQTSRLSVFTYYISIFLFSSLTKNVCPLTIISLVEIWIHKQSD